MRPFHCELGRSLDDQGLSKKTFTLTEKELAEHLLVCGRTGSGKSRLLLKLIMEHLRQRRALIVIDPGDLADDALGSCARQIAETGSRAILERIHYAQLSPFLCFGYDPFKFRLYRAVHPELIHTARAAWLHCRVDAVSEIIQGKQGQSDFEGQPRLQRVLRSVLYCAGTEVSSGRLSVPDARLLIDFTHPLHQEVYERVAPGVPRSVRCDFEVLHQMRRIEDFRRETESTWNCMNSLLSPLLSACLSHQGPAIDLYEIIQKGHILFVHVPKSDYVSFDQASALGKLFIHDVIETAMATPRERRKECTLMVDEAWQFMSEDLFSRGMNVLRKYLVSLVLSSLDLSSFRKKDQDYVPKVLSQPSTIICFNQRWHQDADDIARVLYANNIDFAPLAHEVERHDGYTWHKVKEYSFSVSSADNWSDAAGHSVTDTRTKQETEADSSQHNTTTTHPLNGNDPGRRTDGAGAGRSRGSSKGQSHAEADTRTKSIGGSRSESTTVSIKHVPLGEIVRESQPTGQLQRAVNDQIEGFKQIVMGLKKRRAVVGTAGEKAFAIQTLDVPDSFSSPTALMKAVEWIKKELKAIHPYYFVPSLESDEEDRRLRAFLAEERADTVESVVEGEFAEESDDFEDDQDQETSGNPFGN